MTRRRLATIAVLAALIIGGEEARAQNRTPSSSDRANVVDKWSSDVLHAVERTVERMAAVRTQADRLSEADYSTFSRLGTGIVLDETNINARDWPLHLSLPLRRVPDGPYGRSLVSLMREILRDCGLPEQLIAVSLVESGFNPFAQSPKGARGLWQLMPETALRFGLNQSGLFDERLDPVRSTWAAAQYLKELYAQFGDWALALAAYNSGEARVRQALSSGHVRDFWSLSRLKLLP